MKLLTTLFAMLLSVSTVNAQEDDTNMFNHMAFGITAGTMGAGLELAMPIGNYVQVRAGATYMPPFSVGYGVHIGNTHVPSDVYPAVTDKNGNVIPTVGFGNPYEDVVVQMNAKVNYLNGKLLFDLFPAPSFPLHVTLGAYFGSEKVFDMTSKDNTDILAKVYHMNEKSDLNTFGPQLGDYVMQPGIDGVINTRVETSMIRPYAGLGWGKAVSDKSFDWMLEAGVLFWNTPKFISTKTDQYGNVVDMEIQKSDMSSKDAPIMKWITHTNLYPVINFRIGFNMF